MKVSVLGATGAMGGLVIKSALQEGGISVANKISSSDDVCNLFVDTDVIVDFSCPFATESMLRYASSNGTQIPLVIGTTGLSKIHKDLMEKCSQTVPVFHSPNMSFLVAIMNSVLYMLGKLLDEDFDVEVLESHHRLKKDAPSGTAIMFGHTVAGARNRNLDDVANFIRYGIIEQRKRGEIGFAVQRCGSVVGTHEVSFVGSCENIKVKHEASSKEIFARGAIQVAKWIINQCNGLYSMNDFTKDVTIPVLNALSREFFEKQ
ncbi:MAG: 4-hydroxy-tetrahydrodipicolinate reductase [Holosporales bacterium]|jgi:4-hydroxy-tetrahydrodipicolinate reductase|nr:4-hydroxy-tetrahydrodipicolinate reductase [Holosporales bacterium]